MADEYEDGEVLDLDANGGIIQWDHNKKASYNCGETLKDFGVENLTQIELDRVQKSPFYSLSISDSLE